jgi:hypothetical protein
MSTPLEMTPQETMALLSFAGKSAEMLEDSLKSALVEMNMIQWVALRKEAVKVLRRLDADWPAMLPLPHDGVGWKDRP